MGRLFHDQNPEAIKEKFDKFNLHGFPWFPKLKVSHRNHYMLNQKRINKQRDEFKEFLDSYEDFV